MAGHLSVTILEATSLKDGDISGGSNDAYVEVYIDEKHKQRTATISNSTNPKWNETFHFHLEPDQDQLYIKVYDEDVVGRDAIGSAKIFLEPVKAAGDFDDWVELPKLIDLGSTAEVHIRMQFRC